MDNGLVLMVTTVHKIGKIVKRNRKRPRKTMNNVKYVDKVWGNRGDVPIYIYSQNY